MALTLLASVACVAVYLWQDGLHDCNDGRRYTSRTAQPYPFHRRFCGWPTRVLQASSLVCLVALGCAMGSWKGALLLLSLPGAWFIATHPTTVDAPAMALAWGSSLLLPSHPVAAVACAVLSGFIHERGPVFAALYAWHPLPLLGVVGVGWWRKAARPDNDALVGHGFIASVRAHKPYNDFLDAKTTALALRGLVPIGAYLGLPAQAWIAMAIAWASRAVGTDFARFMFWSAPLVVAKLPDVPLWMVALHVMTFRRCI